MPDERQRPAVMTISGVEVVTIPLAHYAELLDCQRRMQAGLIAPGRFTANLRSRVDRDPEIATFLTGCFGRMLLKEAVAACLERFGGERTPPQSTVQRFWARLREAPRSGSMPRTHLG